MRSCAVMFLLDRQLHGVEWHRSFSGYEETSSEHVPQCAVAGDAKPAVSVLATTANRATVIQNTTKVFGHPNRPHYRSCSSICPSVCLSVCPVRAPNPKMERRRITKIGVNVPHRRSNQCVNFHFKGSNVKVGGRQKRENDA